MKIKWLGHSSFLIESENGTRIITDPYGKGFMGLPAKFWRMDYNETNEKANIVTVSHPHWDHSYLKGVLGDPPIKVTKVRRIKIKGVAIKGIQSIHGFSPIIRMQNIIFCIELEGLKFCHLGDIGEVLNREQIREIGEEVVDVLFLPVGGFMTVNAVKALKICEKLNPRFVIPMHYRNKQFKSPFFADLSKFRNLVFEDKYLWLFVGEEINLNDYPSEKGIIKVLEFKLPKK